MDRIKNFVPMTAFCLVFLKGLTQSFDTNSIAALFILGSLFAILEFKADSKTLSSLKSEVSALNERVAQAEKRNEEMKTHVSGLKLAQQVKNSQFR